MSDFNTNYCWCARKIDFRKYIFKTIHATVMLRSARTLRKVLETCCNYRSKNSSEKPLANTVVKSWQWILVRFQTLESDFRWIHLDSPVCILISVWMNSWEVFEFSNIRLLQSADPTIDDQVMARKPATTDYFYLHANIVSLFVEVPIISLWEKPIFCWMAFSRLIFYFCRSKNKAKRDQKVDTCFFLF